MEIVENLQSTSALFLLILVFFANTDKGKALGENTKVTCGLSFIMLGLVFTATTLIRIWI